MSRQPWKDAANGRWDEILPQLGVPNAFLSKKHQPCLICGGTDRARFTDLNGDGVWYCSHCEGGDGLSLVMKVNGWSFTRARTEVEKLLGVKSSDNHPPPSRTHERLWRAGQTITAGTPAEIYLASRGLFCPHALRWHPALPYPGGDIKYPALLALVTNAQGRGVAVHRTFLAPDGSGKAPVEKPRLLTAGQIPPGSAVRLFKVPADVLGVAEGIETAISAAMMFKVPVWPTISTTWLQSWKPPTGVRRVMIFADNDKNYAGHAAAYKLAFRLSGSYDIEMMFPPEPGTDWNDEYRKLGSAADADVA